MAKTPHAAARQIVNDLKGTWHGRYGKVRCPAHTDARASLSVTPGRKAVLFHCFAGCSQDAVLSALRHLHSRPGVLQSPDGTEANDRDLTRLVRKIWDLAWPICNTPAARYLERRGIGRSLAGRYSPSVLTYEAGRKVRLPALLLPMTKGRELCALQRIFLDSDGRKSTLLEEPKRTLGDPRRSMIQLGKPAGNTLNLAEGFEDAESAIVLRDLSGCSAVCGAERYRDIAIPGHVRHVVIYSQHGKAAELGIERARDNLTANGRSLEIVIPPLGGDWNDALQARLADTG
ncbi:putative primase [Novosphingobium sp. KN65.2]|nr:putative primase [Novosphingobium sp. KN65.2]